MSAQRSYRRSVVDSKTLITLTDRVNRVLLRLATTLAAYEHPLSLDQLCALCQELSPSPCISLFGFSFLSDEFVGGIVLYFWMIMEGDQWIRNLIKKSIKVFDKFSYKRFFF